MEEPWHSLAVPQCGSSPFEAKAGEPALPKPLVKKPQDKQYYNKTSLKTLAHICLQETDILTNLTNFFFFSCSPLLFALQMFLLLNTINSSLLTN